MRVFRDAHAEKMAGPADLTVADAEAPRQRSRTPISERALKAEVQRDLETLMNAIALESTLDIEDFDHVRRSILNYGFPDIGHRTLDDATLTELGGEIVEAVALFEPRLARHSIKVSRDPNPPKGVLSIRFIVQADMLCDPQDLAVEFVAEVEAQSGKIMIGRL